MVIDSLANLRVCMPDSERYNRDMVHVRSREDYRLLPPGLFPIAIAWDNNDVKLTMDATLGAPYVAFMGATAVGIYRIRRRFLGPPVAKTSGIPSQRARSRGLRVCVEASSNAWVESKSQS